MINDLVTNNIKEYAPGLWTLGTGKQIKYSDGSTSEHYLSNVFRKCTDLSSNSHELGRYIRDWASEYHLSNQRANLLKGFDFNTNSEVLEVGCGCGAITRFLGETFNSVISIEGNLNRANLARLRTRDLKNVEILCGPFQEIEFKKKFDIIFCIGVFEYSNVFVEAEDPYDHILNHFKGILKSDGVLILAIENQFGLKYFSSCTEDHTHVMFDGIEGYPRYRNKAKTFGYNELKDRLARHFDNVDFLFPYPDYKLPQCVLSEKLFDITSAGELVGNFKSRDYLTNSRILFDEQLALLELQKNNMIHFFSNSFLITAGQCDSFPVKQSCLGAIYSKGRVKELQTVTKLIEGDNSSIKAIKTLIDQSPAVSAGKLTLHQCESDWVSGPSLQLELLKKTKEHDVKMEKFFSLCSIWLDSISSLGMQGDKLLVHGRFIDYTWKNCIIHKQECNFIDKEWEWNEPIHINVLIIRTIFIFLNDANRMTDINPFFRAYSTKNTIKKIARHMDTTLTNNDFRTFCKIESELQSLAYGRSVALNYFEYKLILWNRPAYTLVGNIKRWLEYAPIRARKFIDKIINKLQAFRHRQD